MKKHIFLWLAAMIVGGFFFLLWYFVFGKAYDTSVSLGLAAAGGGLVAEYIKPLLSKKRR